MNFLPEILILISLILGAYQDFKTRSVSDYVWLPLIPAMIIQTYYFPLALGGFILIGSLCALLAFSKLLGIADIFALATMGSLPSFWAIITSFTFFIISGLIHISIRYLRKENLQNGRYPFVVYSFIGYVSGFLFLAIVAKS